MCCFSPITPVGWLARLFPPRVHVADTSIFARARPDGQQLLAYSMELSVAGEVAMLLPVPIRPELGEAALEFVSLADHPTFFEALHALFVVEQTAARKSGGVSLSLPRQQLVVHRVGAFEASFVPSPHDFGRLDPRFQLPSRIWSELGDYRDHGFAVFRLEPGRKQRVHPMAFRFARRDPSRLFFPTVHVHDGRVRPTARFDHWLYYQGREGRDERSFFPPSRDYAGMLEPGAAVFRRQLRGRLPNQDTWIEA